MAIFAIFAVIALVGGGIGYLMAWKAGRLAYWLPVAGAAVFAAVMYVKGLDAHGWDGIGYAIGIMFAATAAAGWLLGGAVLLLIRRKRGAP